MATNDHTTKTFQLGYQTAMNDLTRMTIDAGPAVAIDWLLNNTQSLTDEQRDALTQMRDELTPPRQVCENSMVRSLFGEPR